MTQHSQITNLSEIGKENVKCDHENCQTLATRDLTNISEKKYPLLIGFFCEYHFFSYDYSETNKSITFEDLNHMSFTNSKDLPQHIKFTIEDKTYYQTWMGVGWAIEKENDKAIEVIE